MLRDMSVQFVMLGLKLMVKIAQDAKHDRVALRRRLTSKDMSRLQLSGVLAARRRSVPTGMSCGRIAAMPTRTTQASPGQPKPGHVYNPHPQS